MTERRLASNKVYTIFFKKENLVLDLPKYRRIVSRLSLPDEKKQIN
jgi:hypothetical protein